MNDNFVIHGIDPTTGNVSVTFTINGATYPQIFQDLPTDSSDSLNQVLAVKLASIKSRLTLNESYKEKQFDVEVDDIGKVSSITAAQFDLGQKITPVSEVIKS